MSGRCLEAFKQFVKLVPDTHNVGVAFKGGPDSLALLWLAKNTFKNVTAFTLDLTEVHPEDNVASSDSNNSSSSERVGVKSAIDLATAMGVNHHVIPLSYQANLSTRQFGKEVRRRNYTVVLDECRKQNIKTLLTGHNMDDCLESTFGVCKTAGTVDSFSYFTPIQYFSSHMDIQVLRPLAKCPRSDILSLCREEGLRGVAEASPSERTLRKKLLEDDPQLRAAVSGYASDLQRVRADLRSKVIHAFKQYITFNKYGYLMFRYSQLNSLPRAVLWRLLHLSNLCVTCTYNTPKLNNIRSVWERLATMEKDVQASLINCKVMKDNDRVPMVNRVCKDKVSISPGQTLLWDHRWKITFHEQKPGLVVQKKFYVCAHLARFKTPFRVKQNKKNIHPLVCMTLPVITDDDGKLVFFPHLEKVSKDGQRTAPWTISYQPVIHLDQWGYLCL